MKTEHAPTIINALLKHPNDIPLLIEPDVIGGRNRGESGHGHDVSADHHHELRARHADRDYDKAGLTARLRDSDVVRRKLRDLPTAHRESDRRSNFTAAFSSRAASQKKLKLPGRA